MRAETLTQQTFYPEYVMTKRSFEPQSFGVDLTRVAFDEAITDAFNNSIRGQISFDELLLHPRSALRFCDDIRMANGWHDVPDDIILRVVMTSF